MEDFAERRQSPGNHSAFTHACRFAMLHFNFKGIGERSDVAGSRDELAPPELIRQLMGQWNPEAQMDTIEGADHFFSGFLDEVTRRLVNRISSHLAGPK